MIELSLPCPYCGAAIAVDFFRFSPQKNGTEVFCGSCRRYATFPRKAKLAAVLAGFAATACVVLFEQYRWSIADSGFGAYFLCLVSSGVTYLVVSAAACRAFKALAPAAQDNQRKAGK